MLSCLTEAFFHHSSTPAYPPSMYFRVSCQRYLFLLDCQLAFENRRLKTFSLATKRSFTLHPLPR